MNIQALLSRVALWFGYPPLPVLSSTEAAELLRLLDEAEEKMLSASAWMSTDLYIMDALSNALYLLRREAHFHCRVLWGDLRDCSVAENLPPRKRHAAIVAATGKASEYIEKAASAKGAAVPEVYKLIREAAVLVGSAKEIVSKLVTP